jgi:TrkA domain protein
VVGLTVVAVVRGDSANPAPAEDFTVFPGDTLVVAGTPEKVAKAFAFYRTGEMPQKASIDAPPGG